MISKRYSSVILIVLISVLALALVGCSTGTTPVQAQSSDVSQPQQSTPNDQNLTVMEKLSRDSGIWFDPFAGAGSYTPNPHPSWSNTPFTSKQACYDVLDEQYEKGQISFFTGLWRSDDCEKLGVQ